MHGTMKTEEKKCIREAFSEEVRMLKKRKTR